MSATEYIAQSDGHTVCKGFHGNNPDRFWCDADSDDAKTWPTYEQALAFTRRTGDRSWNWAVVER